MFEARDWQESLGVRVGLRDVEPLLKFLAATGPEPCLADIMPALHHSVAALGLKHFALRVDVDAASRPAEIDGASNLPKSWNRHMAEQNYLAVSPVLRFARTTRAPYNWFDILSRREVLPIERRVLQESFDFGVGIGLAVPVHPLDRPFSVFIATSDPESDPTADVIRHRARAIQLLGLGIYEVAAPLLRGRRIALDELGPDAFAGNDNEAPKGGTELRKPLSPFEREFLSWSATGMNTWDISERLCLSHAAVEQSRDSAQRALGAGTSSHAVVKAIIGHLVQP